MYGPIYSGGAVRFNRRMVNVNRPSPSKKRATEQEPTTMMTHDLSFVSGLSSAIIFFKEHDAMANAKTLRSSAPASDPPTANPILRTRVLAASTRKPPTQQEIAERAYYLWKETGCCNEAENWTKAERQLKTERGA